MTFDDCASELTSLGSVFLNRIHHHIRPSLRVLLKVREGIDAVSDRKKGVGSPDKRTVTVKHACNLLDYTGSIDPVEIML